MQKYQRKFKSNAVQLQEQAIKKGIKMKRKRIIPSFMKENNITYSMISEWFGYNNPNSFHNAARKQDIINGIEQLISYLKK